MVPPPHLVPLDEKITLPKFDPNRIIFRGPSTAVCILTVIIAIFEVILCFLVITLDSLNILNPVKKQVIGYDFIYQARAYKPKLDQPCKSKRQKTMQNLHFMQNVC